MVPSIAASGTICCGPSDATETLGTAKQTYLKRGPGDDMYARALKAYYFPLLLRYHRYGCYLWVAIFVISIVFGPRFLALTQSNLDLPPKTSSSQSSAALQANYPDKSRWTPSFVVAQSNNGQFDFNTYPKSINAALDNFVLANKDIISGKTGYYDFIDNPNLKFLASKAVSANNQTMVFTINFKKETDLTAIKETVLKLQKFAEDQSYPNIKVGCTGLEALFNDLAVGSTLAFELIDAVVIPVSLCILGFNLRSYRHVLVAIVSLGCTLLLALAILVPIANTVPINPFAPSILLTLGVAVCFDYSLFILSRYREEILVNKLSKEEAVYVCLLASGHVVLLSGFTLFITFVLLIAFPQNFLQSVGYGCATIICTAVLSNMTVTPCLLLTFDCLTKFDAFPSIPSFCRQLCCKNTIKSEENPQEAEQGSARFDNTSRVEGNEGSVSRPNENDLKGSELTITNAGVTLTPRKAWFHIAYFGAKRPYLTLLISLAITVPFAIQWSNLNASSDNNLVFLRGSSSLKFLGILASAFPIGAIDPYQIIVTTGVPGGVNTQAYFDTESNLVKKLLREQSRYVDAKSITSLSFFNGQYVDFATSQSYLTPSSPQYSGAEATRYRILAASLRNTDNSATVMEVETIVDPVGEVIVPFILSVRRTLLDPQTTLYSKSLPVTAYLYGGYCSTYDIQVIMYELYPIMIASTIAVVVFIIGVSFGSLFLPIRLLITVAISLCWTYGLLVIVYQPGPGRDAFIKLNPVLKSSSGGSSVAQAIDGYWCSNKTLILQHCHRPPMFLTTVSTLHYAPGVYWLVPIMSFSILVGLAMDYDIFLMLRVLEFRQLGWSDRAAVCLAVEKTGNVITAAGLIMSISFAGLLLPPTTVLNQFGFVLFIGVAIDTFIVRTIIVPAAVTAFSLSLCRVPKVCMKTADTNIEDANECPAYLNSKAIGDDHEKSVWRASDADVNWWPYLVPKAILSLEGEEAALWAGYNNPTDYIAEMEQPTPVIFGISDAVSIN